MALTELQARQAKPATKDYPLADEKGLRLLVRLTGSKTWQLRYRRPVDNKADIFTIGTYPETSLKTARENRDKARALISQGIDPKQNQKATKASNRMRAGNTFEAIAQDWFATISPEWSDSHRVRTTFLLKHHLHPWIGKRPITEITPPELLAALKRAQDRGLLETAMRAKQVAGQIFRFAIRIGAMNTDPSRDLAGALTSPKTKHFK